MKTFILFYYFPVPICLKDAYLNSLEYLQSFLLAYSCVLLPFDFSSFSMFLKFITIIRILDLVLTIVLFLQLKKGKLPKSPNCPNSV